MTTKCVDFFSKTLLNCSNCFPADAVLCLPSELVLSGLNTIDASLVYFCTKTSACGDPIYLYKFEYDDALLVADTILTSTNVNGAFCLDCLTTWILDQLELLGGS